MGYKLPAEQYDYLKAQAEQFGGVGHTALHKWVDGVKREAPRCLWGIAQWESVNPDHGWVYSKGEPIPAEYVAQVARSWAAREALFSIALYPNVSDRAFTGDERKDLNFRLPFDVWAERLGVVRV